jgi:hypothetical protein
MYLYMSQLSMNSCWLICVYMYINIYVNLAGESFYRPFTSELLFEMVYACEMVYMYEYSFIYTPSFFMLVPKDRIIFGTLPYKAPHPSPKIDPRAHFWNGFFFSNRKEIDVQKGQLFVKFINHSSIDDP